MIHALLILGVELGAIMALVEVRYHYSLAVLYGRRLQLDCVRQKVDLLSVFDGFLALRLRDLGGLVVFSKEDLGPGLLKLLVHENSYMLTWLLFTLEVDCIDRRDQLGRARELVLNELLTGRLLAHLAQLLLEVPHTSTLLSRVN